MYEYVFACMICIVRIVCMDCIGMYCLDQSGSLELYVFNTYVQNTYCDNY